MPQYDTALRIIGKEIRALREEAESKGEPLPPTPYVVLDIASRVNLDRGEWYCENLAYLANIRRLVDRILRGDGVEYLRQQRKRACQAGVPDEDIYGTDTDWGDPREAGRAVGRLFPGVARSQKLKRALCWQ